MSVLPHPLQHLLRIMADALGDHEGTVRIVGGLVNHLEEASTAYGMQISAEKTQLMTNNTNGISSDITIDNKKLETVRSFIYWEL